MDDNGYMTVVEKTPPSCSQGFGIDLYIETKDGWYGVRRNGHDNAGTSPGTAGRHTASGVGNVKRSNDKFNTSTIKP